MCKMRATVSLWPMFLSIIGGLILVACAQRSGQASSPQGTLSGIVVAGPTCPGPTTFPERPECADQPVPALQLRITFPAGQVVTTTTTDRQGHFTVALPAGSYLVTARFGIRGLQSTPARVVAGQSTTVQITLDTGMR